MWRDNATKWLDAYSLYSITRRRRSAGQLLPFQLLVELAQPHPQEAGDGRRAFRRWTAQHVPHAHQRHLSVQRRRGYLLDEVVSEALGLGAAALTDADGVARHGPMQVGARASPVAGVHLLDLLLLRRVLRNHGHA